MPEINSLISVSSSTTRMSDAMAHSLCFLGGLRGFRALRRVRRCSLAGARIDDATVLALAKRQVHAHGSALTFAVPLGRVRQMQCAPVLLGDALDDGEPEPRALRARGHIGLDQ